MAGNEEAAISGRHHVSMKHAKEARPEGRALRWLLQNCFTTEDTECTERNQVETQRATEFHRGEEQVIALA